MASPSAPPPGKTTGATGRIRAAAARVLLAGVIAFAACGRVAPRYEPASLTVLSTPAGAAILFDGRDTGQVTPCTFTGLDAAMLEVRVALPDWFSDPESIPVDLRPLDDAEISFTLHQTGLRVTSEPSGARILIDGADTGKVTPATVAGLEPGTVQVALELDTWLCVPASLPVTVVEGAVVEVLPEDLRLRSRRTVLLESFGNISCATCAPAAENLVTLSGTPGFGPDRAVYLEFSVSWPSPVDPFYLANPTENAARYTYYYVLGAPALYVDGAAQADPLDLSGSAAAVTARWDIDPGFLLDVAADLQAGATVPVTVTLTPLADLDLEGCILFVALYEDRIAYDAPPGNNGQSVFHHMFRDRVDTPPALGAFSSGEPATFELTLNRGAVSPDNATVVAFVQRVADKVVLQAGSTATAPGKAAIKTPLQPGRS